MAPEYATIDGRLPEDREGADWGIDPESGAQVVRLTSAAAWSHNIYCEQPYGSPDGRRVLVARGYDLFALHRQLLVADLETRRLTLIEPDVPTEAVAHFPWSEWVYYVMHDGSLRRFSLVTFQRQLVGQPGTLPTPPDAYLQSITPDDRLIICDEKMDGDRLRSFALDLTTGERRVLCDDPENLNPHSQCGPPPGRRRLYQLIRRTTNPPGVPVFVQPLDGGEPLPVPFGAPWSAESTGHMAWIGSTGRVACTVNWQRAEKRHDPRHPQGNLLTAAPGDPAPTVFPAPRHGFYHVSISRCGRYFVADDFFDFRADAFRGRFAGPTRIVVGCLASGASRVLIGDVQAYGIAGSSRYEPDPYFTADNRHIIYNASPFGITQVFAARVPEGFLAGLSG